LLRKPKEHPQGDSGEENSLLTGKKTPAEPEAGTRSQPSALAD